MAIFDRFRGKKKEADAETSVGDAAAAASISPNLDLTEQAAPQQSDAAAKLLGYDAQDATRLYNPYEGRLQCNISCRRILKLLACNIHFFFIIPSVA
jgi:hypothetical protein